MDQSSETPALTTPMTSPEHALPLGAPHPKVKAEDTERYEIWYDIQRSIRYHRAREAFYQWYANTFTFLTLLAGSGIVMSLLGTGPKLLSVSLGVAVAAAQIIELVFQIAHKARLHNSLASEFMALDRVMTRTPSMDEKALAEIRSDILTIEAREPPIKRYLDLICHNQVARMIGSKDLEKLTFWQRNLANWLSGSTALQKIDI